MRKTFLYSIILLLITLQLGCQNNKSNSNSLANEVTYTSEEKDLIEAINKNNFNKVDPSNYKLTNSIKLLNDEDADRIEYETFIQEPKIPMNNVIMSFYLEPSMLQKLNTSNVFQTNTHNDEKLNILPSGKVQGASLARAFILDPSKIDQTSIHIYKTMYIKISYDSDNKRIEDYYKVSATPSDELESYLKNNTH
ncbi:hypothetical protein [Paenibacillus radicis (ex Gao et al. 2016)]|uniref:Lipoprotein n=1 Tax=Paenibacillus radicis (ex Gao et al. 2016) TaxID=1737354 RepID=A0A917HEU1_9BACL|nr:hypothetical protein [Paenibacillus radicis (ex Gao et al. 2016)]GGG76634.1 hypothetical protein GCM10010918_36430 [Paenibacillus radicis (ex Gao et al. 2016)]